MEDVCRVFSLKRRWAIHERLLFLVLANDRYFVCVFFFLRVESMRFQDKLKKRA